MAGSYRKLIRNIAKMYPYELYCTGCNDIIAFSKVKGNYGEAIRASECINRNGKVPQGGDTMPTCKCTGTNHIRSYASRLRT